MILTEEEKKTFEDEAKAKTNLELENDNISYDEIWAKGFVKTILDKHENISYKILCKENSVVFKMMFKK